MSTSINDILFLNNVEGLRREMMPGKQPNMPSLIIKRLSRHKRYVAHCFRRAGSPSTGHMALTDKNIHMFIHFFVIIMNILAILSLYMHKYYTIIFILSRIYGFQQHTNYSATSMYLYYHKSMFLQYYYQMTLYSYYKSLALLLYTTLLTVQFSY